MENTEKDSSIENFASPIDEPKSDDIIDLTQDTDGEDATIQGGKPGGRGKRRQGSENRRMELPSDGGGSKPGSSVPMVVRDLVLEPTIEKTNLEDPTKGSASTCIINHQQKLCEGGGADEKAMGHENSPSTHGLQGLDPNQQMKEDLISTNDATYETPVEPADGKERNEVETMAIKDIEVDSFVMEKTEDGGKAKIFEFDLNDLPVEVDKNWWF